MLGPIYCLEMQKFYNFYNFIIKEIIQLEFHFLKYVFFLVQQ